MLAPLIVVALAVPVIVVASLLLVAWLMTPSLVNLVAARRFETLERKRGAGWFSAALWSSAACCWRCCCWCLSLPLWFIPPLVLVLPPLIWGWLTYKVMSFDVLAEHASADERKQLMRDQHWPLLAIGIVTGYLGAAPIAALGGECGHAGAGAGAGGAVGVAVHAGLCLCRVVVCAFRAGGAAAPAPASRRRRAAGPLEPARCRTLPLPPPSQQALHRQRWPPP